MRKEYLALLAAGCVAANATNVNYDLLGRKGSKMNSPMVYKNVDYSKFEKKEQQKLNSSLETKALAKQASGIKSGAKAIVGKFGPNGYGFSACSQSCVGSGKSGLKVSWGTEKNVLNYLNDANQHFINVDHQEKSRLSSEFNYVTAGPTRSNLSGYTMTETPYNFNVPQSNAYATFNDVNGYLGRVIKSKTNVGVYVAGNAVPVRLNKEDDTYAPFILSDNTTMNNYGRMPADEMYAARMFRLIHLFSDQSSVFAAKTRPSNPAGANPQIYVGLHGDKAGSSNSHYATQAKDLDNYIYRNRTVEIVAAGNHSSGLLSPEGYAANAITVGARNVKNNVATGYQEATYTSGSPYNKPEIYNYTNFYVNDYKRAYSYPGKQDKTFLPYYEGSEAAAAITAGMVSNMVSYNEFYKWHPEVVKAVMVNAMYNVSRPVDYPLNYNDLVFDQTNSQNQHYSYYFIGDVNSLMGNYHNSSPNEQFAYSTDKRKIRIHITKSQLQNNGFSIAISWLNSGSDIIRRHQLPQIFEIDLYCTDGNSKLTRNTSTTYSPVSVPRDTPYRQTYAYFNECQNASSLMADIVLDEDYEDAENYGQIVLGVDIQPIR